jgi:hypothetical protein
MNGIGVTAFGVIAVTFMMATYAAESVKAGLKLPSFRRSEIPHLRTDFV